METNTDIGAQVTDTVEYTIHTTTRSVDPELRATVLDRMIIHVLSQVLTSQRYLIPHMYVCGQRIQHTVEI